MDALKVDNRTDLDVVHDLVRESWKIEGLSVSLDELLSFSKTYEHVFEQDTLSVDDVVDLARHFTDGKGVLRDKIGMNAFVGGYRPPLGSCYLKDDLQNIIELLNINHSESAYSIHCQFEKLHPFTDGNGRTGRLLWAWKMVHDSGINSLRLGFLHTWYYQSLEALSC